MKRTPLYEEHVRLGGKMVEFGGWEMPLNFPSGILSEHLATRKYGGIFDISHMGRFKVSGNALPFLQYVLSNNAAALLPGQAQYTIIPTPTGGAVDDAYLYRPDEKEYVLVVNAANSEKDWAWFAPFRSKYPGLILEDHTADIAMLSIQGPESKALMRKIVEGGTLPEPAHNYLSIMQIMNKKVPVARTGYTGDPVGFELFVPAEIAVALYRKLLESGKERGMVPAGLGARDTLRLEAGLPLYGHELGTDTLGKEIPVFAIKAARFAVSFAAVKGEYIGRDGLLKQFNEVKLRAERMLSSPPDKYVVPKSVMTLAVSGGIARAGSPVYLGEKLAGHITSGTAVPYWVSEGAGVDMQFGNESKTRALALAYIDSDARVRDNAKIIVREREVTGTVTKRNLGVGAPPYARPVFLETPEPEISDRKESMQDLATNLVKKACENTTWRQTKTINLIPSENTPSPIVRLLTIADPEGRYAEHRKVEALGNAEVYYYQGTHFIQGVEEELAVEMKKFLGCKEVELRPLSGMMANATVFSALMDYINGIDKKSEPRRLRLVLNHQLGRGGHLSAQPMGALRNFVSIDPVTEKWAVVNFPVQGDNPYQIDIDATAEVIRAQKPELIIFGKSMMIYREPVRDIAKVAAEIRPKPIIMYDSAHVTGLIGPDFQSPLDEGADILTGSTHKTFAGTQRGFIASNIKEGSDYEELWDAIVRRAFPGTTSNHHLGTLLGLLMAAYEMNAYGKDYQKQIISNAKAFAKACKDAGLHVEGDPKIGYTETHQVLLRVGYARGVEMAERLEKNNIIANYQALPDDEGFTAASGIRTGVQEMTRFGMKEKDFPELAGYMAEIILRNKNVGAEVAEFRSRFLQMQYCLPEAQTAPLVAELKKCVTGY
jgi:aminomethyltransferase